METSPGIYDPYGSRAQVATLLRESDIANLIADLMALQGGSAVRTVQVVGASNRALSGVPVIDGYQTFAGDQVLLVGQTTASQNGPWMVTSSGPWTRPSDFASGTGVTSRRIQVNGGTTYASSIWTLSTTTSIIVDTNPQNWTNVSVATVSTVDGGSP